MKSDELAALLREKGYYVQIRIDDDAPDVRVVWATDRKEHDYHLGVEHALLALTVEQFRNKWMYRQIGRSREELLILFAYDVISLYNIDGNEENIKILLDRATRLYNELRHADW